MLAKRKLKWVLVRFVNRQVWFKREEILDAKLIASVNGHDTYQILLSDGRLIAPCELESRKIYEELIKKN